MVKKNNNGRLENLSVHEKLRKTLKEEILREINFTITVLTYFYVIKKSTITRILDSTSY